MTFYLFKGSSNFDSFTSWDGGDDDDDVDIEDIAMLQFSFLGPCTPLTLNTISTKVAADDDYFFVWTHTQPQTIQYVLGCVFLCVRMVFFYFYLLFCSFFFVVLLPTPFPL